MSFNYFKKYRVAAAAALTLAMAGGLTSCDSVIYDDLEECRQGVEIRFVYDYNMEFANAFPSQVDCVTLFVYDENGNYLRTYTESGDVLKDENYRMVIDDLEGGNYHFLAYGGMHSERSSSTRADLDNIASDTSSFEWTSDPETTPMTDLQTRLRPDCITSPVGTNLHPLFYGDLELEVKDDWHSYQTATIHMMKDTNNIRIVLQQADGEPLSNDWFDFTITDDNTLMAWDNAVIPTSTIAYQPWTRGNALAGTWADGTDAQVAFAEFSTARLVTSNQPRLTITRKDGHEVLSIPLINYLLLLKSEQYAQMPPQEFLDRESRWSLIFFLDRNHVWLRTQIIINGWVVRLNNADFS